MAIKKSIKTRWIKALRSGKFLQANGALVGEVETGVDQDSNSVMAPGFCCLGVLATIVDPGKKTWSEDDAFFGGQENDGDASAQFSEQVKLLGGCLPKGYVNKLAAMNDGVEKDDKRKLSFARIASWIERSKRI